MMPDPVEHYYPTPKGNLCWFEWGQAGTGPSLLLLHATGFHARCWDQVVAALPGDIHIIAPDLRGHGRSYRPDSLGEWNQTADEIAALVAGVCDRPVFAIGHSQGGYIAVTVAIHNASAFSQMLLVDPVLLSPALLAMRASVPLMAAADHPVARRRNRWDSATQMAAHFSTRVPYDGWQPDVLADYCHYGLVPATDGTGLELACPPVLEASAYLGATRDGPFGHFDRITCPVTVLRARDGERKSMMDFSFSPTWPDLAAQFPQGHDLQWHDVTHFIPMEQPERLAGLIAKLMGSEQSNPA
jgi:pimeloyl-ACP methyl ester carboxylesterase